VKADWSIGTVLLKANICNRAGGSIDSTAE